MGLTHLLHPTDFSDSATHALRQAVRLALAHQAKLHVFHAMLLHAEDPAQEQPRLDAYAEVAAREAREWAAGSIRPEASLDYEVSVGRAVSAHDAIMEKIGQLKPELLVLGTHGRSGLSKFLMGSDAEKLLRHAPCDVLSLRADARLGGTDGSFRRVLVPVDFSEPSRRALETAKAHASETDSLITLLHAVEPIPPMYLAGGLTSRFQLDSDLPARVSSKLEEWGHGGADQVLVTEGPTASEIIRIADEIRADLVVMGSHGLSGLEHVLVGSVTEKVCRFARTPVLVVK